MDKSLILGPPGTGKTTELLRIVDVLLSDGYAPSKICFVAFTRRAANEAKTRAIEKFGFDGDDLPWFRTLHSLAFSRLGLNKANVMGPGDYVNICNLLGLHVTTRGIDECGNITGLSHGDRLFFMEMMSRTQMIGLHEYWERHPDEDVLFEELELLSKTIVDYKRDRSKLDFTDMIALFCDNPSPPDCSVLIVDEAQDLSPLQWRMVNALSRVVSEMYIAGDDDQAIFKWAGADVNHFINLEGNRTILPKSYRVPACVHNLALDIIGNISSRIVKRWGPRDFKGDVTYISSISQLDMRSGTWMLLARNMFLLDEYQEHCLREGLYFESPLHSPLRGDTIGAIRAWERLWHDEAILVSDAKQIYSLMSAGEGFRHGCRAQLDRVDDACMIGLGDLRKNFGLLASGDWVNVLVKICAEEREYLDLLLSKGDSFIRLSSPPIRISTIHAIKGGEADNVVLMTDMASRTFREYLANPDDEHRVWYVGCTRARERLFVVQPKTQWSYGPLG